MFERRLFRAVAAAVTFSVAAVVTTTPVWAKHPAASVPAPTAQLTPPQLFTRGSSTLFNPDGLVITKRYVFIVWQGQSDHLPGPSTIVKYDHQGNALGSVALTGRCDGLRLNPSTNQLWALLNNDGLNGNPARQPYLATVDPRTLAAKLYAFPAVQPHGGGYDDLAFIGDSAYLSASSPTLNPAKINDKPVVVKATLTSAGKVDIVPILYGNAVGWDATAKKFDRFNISDPDSLAVNASNDLVLVGDNDQELVVIQYPGTSKQKAIRSGYATQFDDVAWTSGQSGTLWIADTSQNAIYTVEARFKPGTVFTETGAGNPVNSFIGTIGGDLSLTPLLTSRDGIFSPTSLNFVPAGGPIDNI